MYAKLFSRITESSLMEEDIPTRWVFVALLAMSDPQGYCIGTDVALARRINVPLATFRAALKILMAPDPDSNSKEHEGRRIIESDAERGYLIVNKVRYRDMKDEDARRDYHREYMNQWRAQGKDKSRPRQKQSVNTGEHSVSTGDSRLRQEEGEGEGKGEGKEQGESVCESTVDLRIKAQKPHTHTESVLSSSPEKPTLKSFRESPYFDLSTLQNKLPDWPEARVKHYYAEALAKSDAKQGKSFDWLAEIRTFYNWDKKMGQTPDENGSGSSRPRRKSQFETRAERTIRLGRENAERLLREEHEQTCICCKKEWEPDGIGGHKLSCKCKPWEWCEKHSQCRVCCDCSGMNVCASGKTQETRDGSRDS